MIDRRAEQRTWVKALTRHLGVSATQLARRAGLAPSTLNKLLNDPGHPSLLSDRSLVALAEAAGVGVMEMPEEERAVDHDVERFEPPENFEHSDALRALCAGPRPRQAWVMLSDLLAPVGILGGDVLILDPGRMPEPGEIAIATSGAGSMGGRVARVYRPPFLVAGPRADPILVDGQRVRLLGTVMFSLRINRRTH